MDYKSIKNISYPKNDSIRTPNIKTARFKSLKESTREKTINNYFKIKKERSEIRRQIAKETIDGIYYLLMV